MEAKLVDALRESGEHLISLVAEDGDDLVGHILFSPVTLTANEGDLRIMGLAPMAVLPTHRERVLARDWLNGALSAASKTGTMQWWYWVMPITIRDLDFVRRTNTASHPNMTYRRGIHGKRAESGLLERTPGHNQVSRGL